MTLTRAEADKAIAAINAQVEEEPPAPDLLDDELVTADGAYFSLWYFHAVGDNDETVALRFNDTYWHFGSHTSRDLIDALTAARERLS